MRPSFIAPEDLTRVAHALAAGQTQPQMAKDFGWDKNTLRRCVDRLSAEVLAEGERRLWVTAKETALEWLRMRGVCTPEELDAALANARRIAQQLQKTTLEMVEHERQVGRHDSAERRLRQHLRDDPDNAVVMVELALCLLDTRLGEASNLLFAALALAPEYARAHYVKTELCRRYVKLFPTTVRALSQVRQGHWPENAVGYIIELRVFARDAGEAQLVALAYLRNTEPPSVDFQLEFKPTVDCWPPPDVSFVRQYEPTRWLYKPSPPSPGPRAGLRRRPTRRRGGR